MRMAIALSEENIGSGNGGPFGAVIVKQGKVIAASGNRVLIENDPTAHAEISAIRIASKALGTPNLSGCEIYTSCEPCPMCLGAIYWAGIEQIYYANTRTDAASAGFDDDLIYNEIELDLNSRRLEFTQLLREEALNAFHLWLSEQRYL